MKIRDMDPLRTAALLLASLFLAAAPGSHSHEDYRELFRDGMRRRDMGNWQEALVFFDEALKREPEEGKRVKLYGRRRFPHYLPRFYVGEALFKIGDYAKALEMWEAYDEGGAYAGVLPEDQRATIEQYREQFKTRFFPSSFENLAGDLLVTRASLRSLESYRNRVGAARWRELESRAGAPIGQKTSEDSSRLDEITLSLEEAEGLLADSRTKRDYDLAQKARETLEPVVFELVALKQAAERSAVEGAGPGARGSGALEEAIRSVYSSPGCPKEAIVTIEEILMVSGPAPSNSSDVTDASRLALVSGYVKCDDLKTAQRYVEAAPNDLRRIARAAVGDRKAPPESAVAVASSPLYPESDALVVGISDYKRWPDLPGVERDVQEVSKVLNERGFQVDVRPDLDRKGLESAIEEFLSNKGRRADAQLLFYYAGHGHVIQKYGNEVPFMVPADAPAYAGADEASFTESAVSLSWLLSRIETLQARHALFVFDSCFAGTVFDRTGTGVTILSTAHPTEGSASGSRGVRISGAGDEAATGKRRSIDVYLNSPVRYFLTAGAADQRVPDESLFRKAFVDGLRGRIPNDDDILSAEELALFVEDQVTAQNGWTQVPMYGRLLLAPRVSQGGRILFRVPLWTAALQGGRKVGDRGTSSLELMTALPTQSIADASMSR
jgi:tetratricopeptide (TPR) repeat protein